MDEEKKEEVVDSTEDEAAEKIDKIEEELKEPGLTQKQLDDLREELRAEIRSLHRDRSKDDQEKAELEGKIEHLEQVIEEMRAAQEEHNKKREDETTLIVPPPELNPPTHQNVTETNIDVQPENPNPDQMKRKRRLSWW